MTTIYLDNAATTPLFTEVSKVVTESMLKVYGNPSSTHQEGRKAKAAIETARKNIAKHFNAAFNEIVFTSGGSEADNLILTNAVVNLGVTTIISSKIEHKAVLETIAYLQKTYNVKVFWVKVSQKGNIDEEHLQELLQKNTEKKMVSLMYINNEIGTILNLEKIAVLCKENNVLFHSDTVQGIGRYVIDTQKIPIDFFVSSAHKFHGPKGVGFAFIKKGYGIQPQLLGGSQERGARAGTENIHSILGMEKALEMAYANLKKDKEYIQKMKNYFIDSLYKNFENITFNGNSNKEDESTYTIVNVRFPKKYTMLLFQLDMQGIAVSGGSACQSGSTVGSYVLNEILPKSEAEKTSVRFSFSKLNTIEEIDKTIEILKKIIKK